jgi:hypothetical protein
MDFISQESELTQSQLSGYQPMQSGSQKRKHALALAQQFARLIINSPKKKRKCSVGQQLVIKNQDQTSQIKIEEDKEVQIKIEEVEEARRELLHKLAIKNEDQTSQIKIEEDKELKIKIEEDKEARRELLQKFVNNLEKPGGKGKVWTSLPAKRENALMKTRMFTEGTDIKNMRMGRMFFTELSRNIQQQIIRPKNKRKLVPKVFPKKEEILSSFSTKEQLMSHRLIMDRKGTVCEKCNKGTYDFDSVRNMWRCIPMDQYKNVKPRCDKYSSVFEDSIFFNMKHSKVSPAQVLLISRHLLEGLSSKQSSTEVGCNISTINDWRKKIKRILAAQRLEEVEGKFAF